MYAATPQRSRVSSSRRPTTSYQPRSTHVQIFTKEHPLPKTIKNVQPKGFIACQSKVRDAMGSFMTNRYAGGNTHMTLKQDLITQAKQRCHELGGNAIVECKMAISREMAYGQWGNLAGYIYGTAVHYTLNPPDTRTPQEIHKKVEEARKQEQEDHDTASTEKRTDTDEDTEDKNEDEEEDKPNDSAD